MKRKVFNIVAVLSMAVALAVAGLLASMGVTGKLTGRNIDLIGKVLRGEPLGEETPQVELAATTRPAAAATVQISQNAADAELRNLQILRREQELQYTNTQLIALRNLIAQEREQLRQGRLVLEREILAAQRLEHDAGFKQQLKLYETMPASQVKDVFMNLPDEEAATYLRSMNARIAGRILSQFRTSTEQQRRQKLLELMRAES